MNTLREFGVTGLYHCVTIMQSFWFPSNCNLRVTDIFVEVITNYNVSVYFTVHYMSHVIFLRHQNNGRKTNGEEVKSIQNFLSKDE